MIKTNGDETGFPESECAVPNCKSHSNAKLAGTLADTITSA